MMVEMGQDNVDQLIYKSLGFNWVLFVAIFLGQL